MKRKGKMFEKKWGGRGELKEEKNEGGSGSERGEGTVVGAVELKQKREKEKTRAR